MIVVGLVFFFFFKGKIIFIINDISERISRIIEKGLKKVLIIFF